MNEIYEWKLNESELEAVQCGNVGDYIPCSVIINTPIICGNSTTPNGECIWNLSLYPTGNDHHTAQYAFISLYTRSVPTDIANIFIKYDVQIKEINDIMSWSEHNVNINNKHLFHTLKPKPPSLSLKSQQLKHCKSITFEIYICIQRIVLKQSQRADPPMSPPISPPISPNKNKNNKNNKNKKSNNNSCITPHVQYDEYDFEYKNEGHDDIKTKEFYNNNNISYECYPYSIMPHFDHCITWTIRGKEYGRFIHSEMGQSRSTHWFYIDNFRFKLEVFPNGHKQTSKGCVVIYLDLERLPHNISNIRIHWNFNCLETQTRATSIKDLNNTRLGCMVWLPNALKLEQLYNITSQYKRPRITFILQLNIFHIQYFSKPTNAQFQHITQYKNNNNNSLTNNYNNIYNKQFGYEKCIIIWKLTKILIAAMNDSYVNQSFDSPQFDIWIIRIYPKGMYNNNNNNNNPGGHDPQNSFVLSLKVLPYYLHRDIGNILVRIIFECPQLNIAWNDIASFDAKRNRKSWNIGHVLKCNQLMHAQLSNNYLSFEFKVQIIKLFDFNNEEISDLDKYKYLKKDYEQKQLHEQNVARNNIDFDNQNEHKWNIMRIVNDLQKELKHTKSELKHFQKEFMALRNQQKEQLMHENENENENENDINIQQIKQLLSSNDVKLWFTKVIELPQHYNKFIADGFEDFDTIIEIKAQDLIEMNIDKKGHRIKIIKAVNQVKLLLNQND